MGIKKSTTIYINRDTADLAKTLSAATGRPVARLFRDFLQHLQHSLDGSEPTAIVVGDRVGIEGYAGEVIKPPPPLLSTGLEITNDRYGLDKWINVGSTTSVVLVGTTMNSAIAGHMNLWQELLEDGKPLRVLLQGNLNPYDESPCYTPIQLTRDKVESRRNCSLELLKKLAKSAPENTLEVRNSGASLLSYSAILIAKKDSQADIQIQPYNFLNIDSFTHRPARFVLCTQIGSYVYHVLVDHIEELWQHSFQEPCSSE